MERQKSILGRKKKGPTAAPGDFIALGSKQGKDGDSKRPASPPGRKKDAQQSGLAKKPKLGGSSFSSLGGGNIPQYDEIAISVEATEFLPLILAAEEECNDERSEALICGAVKHLRSNRSKPDQIVSLTLMYLSKSKPALFWTEIIIEAFCGLLKRELALTFKAKGNPTVSVLACNVLMNAFAEEENWPDNFVKVFMEDSLGERVWVDREDCVGFVDNILTAFGTKKSSKHLLKMTTEGGNKGEQPGPSSPGPAAIEDDETSRSSDGGAGANVTVIPRFSCQQTAIETFVLDKIKEVLNHRNMDSSSRNLIRLMTSAVGYAEVRLMAATRVDMWLQNPKLNRVSQDLLLALCTNCEAPQSSDREVIAQLAKMRCKTKQMINHYLDCIREMLTQNPSTLPVLLNQTIYNELSTSRNPNNMQLLQVIFSNSPEPAAKTKASEILAEIFQDLLTNKDDYLRALRMLLREVVKTTRLDMNFYAFCLGLMQERGDGNHSDMDAAHKERYVVSVADLISMDMLLSVSLSVREAANDLLQGDTKNLERLHVFKRKVALIQRDAVWWLHMVVPKLVDLKTDIFLHCLKKVLFLESAEQYYSKDNWPPEGDRWLMLRLVSEAPVLEDTLMRLLVVGLMKEMPLSAPDAVELVDQLVTRAAGLYYELGLLDVLQMQRKEFFDALLNLCAYRQPESIQLPAGYTPPSLAIKNLFWKAWLNLLILTAYNPDIFGETAWQKYPTLQFFMEMVMTNNYNFPPPTTATDEKMAEEFRSRERQIRQQEIHQILEFETHLAAATSKVTITESTSLLAGQLNNNEPMGPARYPPPEILEQLKTLNADLKLGQMLCRSRNPDFLLRIINRQGTSQSMPWLAELVSEAEGSLDVLPVQCLCEFLLHEPEADGGEHTSKHQQLLQRLQALVTSPCAESSTMREVLGYFLQRLASPQAHTRHQALKGLSLVVGRGEDQMDTDSDPHDPHDPSDAWLLKALPGLPLFGEVKEALCLALRKACQVETDPEKIRSYIVFLSQHAVDGQGNWGDLVLDIAQLIVERNAMVSSILPEMTTGQWVVSPRQQEALGALVKLMVHYMRDARLEDKDTISWSDTQDQIRLEWAAGQSATVHILVVHAMIVLLTYGCLNKSSKSKSSKNYKELFNIWIQEDGSMPSGFLLDTSEEALLLPDWLKLRMLRSHDAQLIDAALLEVEPAQLVVFVQSFGIPVASMSRLLAALDHAVSVHPDPVMEAVQDKGYMGKLLDVQRMRGAKGGKVFYQMITEGRMDPDDAEPAPPQPEQSQPDLWNVKGSGEVILPTAADKMARLLQQIFADGKGRERLFQSFIQMASNDRIRSLAMLKGFHENLNSKGGESFANQVFKTTHLSCPLFKILITKQPELHPEILPIMETLNSYTRGQKSMLTSVITQFLATQGLSRGKTRHSAARQAEALLERCSSQAGLDYHRIIDDLKKLHRPELLEAVVDRLMEALLEQGRCQEGTQLACHVLAQEAGWAVSGSSAALFVDWLALLDPEMIQACPEAQETLLFAKSVLGSNPEAKDSKSPSSRLPSSPRPQAHLLALLTHQSSWATLTRCLSRLLCPDRMTSLSPTLVLDFVSACQHIPKVWQGRDKVTHEVDTEEDVLGLTSQQMSVLADLVLEEALINATCGNPPTSSSTLSISKARVDLLLSCLSEDMERVLGVVHRLQDLHSSAEGPRQLLVVHLATSLYLQFPYVQAWLTQPLLTTQLMASPEVQSQTDILSHRLLTTLGQTLQGKLTNKEASKQAEAKMYDANIMCRKMAATHPDIFLRQLPLMAAILSGQSEFSLGTMRQNQQLQLFTYVLGLLELLMPNVFEACHDGLIQVLDAYFSLMGSHGHQEKALGSLVLKLVTILHSFLALQPKRAHPALQPHLPVLIKLAQSYPNMAELKALLTSLTLPRHEADPDLSPASREVKATARVTEPGHTGSSFTMAQLAPIFARFSGKSSENLMQVLRELDELSKRKVDILGHFEQQLRSMMMSSHQQSRNLTFTLVMRALRFNPKQAEHFVATFLDCLECGNPDIVSCALNNLGEFTVLCHEEASIILQKAFQVGIKGSLDTSPFITEALQVLTLHSG